MPLYTFDESHKVQGDQLNMFAVFCGTLKKVTCPLYASVHVYNGQETLSKIPVKLILMSPL